MIYHAWTIIFFIYLSNINRFITFCTHFFIFENIPNECNHNFLNSNIKFGFLYEIGYENNFENGFLSCDFIENFKKILKNNKDTLPNKIGDIVIKFEKNEKTIDFKNLVEGKYLKKKGLFERDKNNLPLKLLDISDSQRQEIYKFFDRINEGLKDKIFLSDDLLFLYRITDNVNNFRERQPIYMELECFNFNYDELNPFPNGSNNALSNNSNRSVNTAFAKIPMVNNSNPDSNVAYTFEASGNEITFFESPLERIQNFRFKFRYHDGMLVDFDNQDINFSIIINQLRDNFKRNYNIRTAASN